MDIQTDLNQETIDDLAEIKDGYKITPEMVENKKKSVKHMPDIFGKMNR